MLRKHSIGNNKKIENNKKKKAPARSFFFRNPEEKHLLFFFYLALPSTAVKCKIQDKYFKDKDVIFTVQTEFDITLADLRNFW